METIGAIMIQARQHRKMSGCELARRAGVHRNTILRLEAGTHQPQLNTFIRICSTLEIPASKLLRMAEKAQ